MPDDLTSFAVVGTAPLLQVRHLSRRFGALQALDDVSFDVAPGEVLGIIGRSGAGKSTLIRCLNGLERPDGGTVTFDDEDITGLPERQMQRVRRRIGMIFQHFNLLSAKTVAQNVALPLKIDGRLPAERTSRVAELLELVGLAGKADAYPAQLSGGQRSILALLRGINRRFGLTIVLITHEMGVVRSIADRVVVLDHGRIAEQGNVAEVFADPRAAVTQSLLQSYLLEVPGDVVRPH